MTYLLWYFFVLFVSMAFLAWFWTMTILMAYETLARNWNTISSSKRTIILSLYGIIFVEYVAFCFLSVGI